MEIRDSDTSKIETNSCGNAYLIQTYNEYGAHDRVSLTGMGKTGDCLPTMFNAIAELISYCFELGGSYMGIAERLRGITCLSPSTIQGQKYPSCIDQIGACYEEKRDEADREAEKEEVNE